MLCSFTACLGPVCTCVELGEVSEVEDDEASTVFFFCTYLHGIIPTRPSYLFALYQFGSLDLLMNVRQSPRLNGRSYMCGVIYEYYHRMLCCPLCRTTFSVNVSGHECMHVHMCICVCMILCACVCECVCA